MQRLCVVVNLAVANVKLICTYSWRMSLFEKKTFAWSNEWFVKQYIMEMYTNYILLNDKTRFIAKHSLLNWVECKCKKQMLWRNETIIFVENLNSDPDSYK